MGAIAISAIIVAAGRGQRLGTSLPKAYVPLNGKPLIEYSLELFARCAQISEIIVVIHPDDEPLFRKLVLALDKSWRHVYGGAHRQDSVLAGVRAASGEYVLVHDAARPLVSLSLVERVIYAMKERGTAVPVVPITESVKRVAGDAIIADIDRSGLFCAQTPQGFERKPLLEALERACAQGRYFTDEASLVSAMRGGQPGVVPGEACNIKITTEADLKLAECLLTTRRAS